MINFRDILFLGFIILSGLAVFSCKNNPTEPEKQPDPVIWNDNNSGKTNLFPANNYVLFQGSFGAMFGGEIDRCYIRFPAAGTYDFTVTDNRLNGTFQVCNSNDTETYSVMGYQKIGSFSTNFTTNSLILLKAVQGTLYQWVSPRYTVKINKR